MPLRAAVTEIFLGRDGAARFRPSVRLSRGNARARDGVVAERATGTARLDAIARRRRVLGDDDSLRGQRVDVHLAWRQPDDGRAIWKPFRVRCVGGVERSLADDANGFDASVEDVGGRRKREPGMSMRVIVPAEELLHEALRLRRRFESPGISSLCVRHARLVDHRDDSVDDLPARRRLRLLRRCRTEEQRNHGPPRAMSNHVSL